MSRARQENGERARDLEALCSEISRSVVSSAMIARSLENTAASLVTLEPAKLSLRNVTEFRESWTELLHGIEKFLEPARDLEDALRFPISGVPAGPKA